jgi:hypothetical protein
VLTVSDGFHWDTYRVEIKSKDEREGRHGKAENAETARVKRKANSRFLRFAAE